ncbi:unnamed protein product [Rotaria sp. Silwood2]|nr:unnamed protein product [Rotaria sp. Silwood2]
MKYSYVQLSHLPDEILMIIFIKLHNISLLSSLIGVNKRLNKIAHDSIFTNRLTLLRFLPVPVIDFYALARYSVYPLPDSIVDRFCLQILLEIHNKIEWLNVEPFSMERILLATNYPNLSGLGLYNIQVENTVHLFSVSSFYSKTNLPSNEDIQKTFRDFKDKQIISCIDYFQKRKHSRCHIYSYPYQLKHYEDITNNFPGRLFKCVRAVGLYDEYPFEHEFLLRITQSFPLLEKLTVINQQRQNNKRFRKSKNENEDLLIVKYPHLIQLNLSEAHKDYHEQFLFDTKTCLPNDVCIHLNYRLVNKVTRNFRRNTIRSNCAKISYVLFYNRSKFPEHLKDYFSHAHIF